jgi:hypothetical protein
LGADDPFFTRGRRKGILTDLPKAKLHLLDAGHFALEEGDDFIADRIREFSVAQEERRCPNECYDQFDLDKYADCPQGDPLGWSCCWSA